MLPGASIILSQGKGYLCWYFLFLYLLSDQANVYFLTKNSEGDSWMGVHISLQLWGLELQMSQVRMMTLWYNHLSHKRLLGLKHTSDLLFYFFAINHLKYGVDESLIRTRDTGSMHSLVPDLLQSKSRSSKAL